MFIGKYTFYQKKIYLKSNPVIGDTIIQLCDTHTELQSATDNWYARKSLPQIKEKARLALREFNNVKTYYDNISVIELQSELSYTDTKIKEFKVDSLLDTIELKKLKSKLVDLKKIIKLKSFYPHLPNHDSVISLFSKTS